MTLVRCNDSADLANVLHCIIEKYEIHDSIDIIILSETLLESVLHGFLSWELIVKFVIKTTHELSKDQRFRISSKVFLQVELGETLGLAIIGKLSIKSKIFCIDEPISEDSLALMDPESYQVFRLFNCIYFSLKQSLEDICQVTNIELIVEVLCSLSELVRHVSKQLESALHQGLNLLVH